MRARRPVRRRPRSRAGSARPAPEGARARPLRGSSACRARQAGPEKCHTAWHAACAAAFFRHAFPCRRTFARLPPCLRAARSSMRSRPAGAPANSEPAGPAARRFHCACPCRAPVSWAAARPGAAIRAGPAGGARDPQDSRPAFAAGGPKVDRPGRIHPAARRASHAAQCPRGGASSH